MKNAMKKITSLLLIAVLLVSALPLAASASGLPAGISLGEGDQQVINQNENVDLPKSGEEEVTPFSGLVDDDRNITVNFVGYSLNDSPKSEIDETVEIAMEPDEDYILAENTLKYHSKAAYITFKSVEVDGKTQMAGYKIPAGAEVTVNVYYIPNVIATVIYGSQPDQRVEDIRIRLPENKAASIATVFNLVKNHEKMSNLRISYTGYITRVDGALLTVDKINPGDRVEFELFNGTINPGPGIIGGGGTIGGGSDNGTGNGGSTGGNNGGSNNGGSSNGTETGSTYTFGYADNGAKFKYDVKLHIFLNGDVDTVNKVITINNTAAKDGRVTLDEVKEIIKSKYNAKDSDGIDYDGLYLATDNWPGKYAYSIGRYDTIEGLLNARKHQEVNIFVMIRNAKTSSGVADSSNPKTGDNIMIAVSTMALAGAALVAVTELKKRKMI